MIKNRKNIILIMITIFMILILSSAFIQKETKNEKEEPDWKKLMVSDDGKERELAKQIILKQYRETVDYLISVVDSPVKEGESFWGSDTSRNIAIYLLGKLRAKEAVPEILNCLFPKPGQLVLFLPRSFLSPAGYALIEIGLPSVPPLVDLLKKEKSVYSRGECIKVIVGIKGISETELLLENILKKETDQTKKENIKSAQDLMKDPKYKKIFENADKMAQGN